MAETNIQKAADFARTSEIYFVEHFKKDIHVLMEVLGLTRKIEKQPGHRHRHCDGQGLAGDPGRLLGRASGALRGLLCGRFRLPVHGEP